VAVPATTVAVAFDTSEMDPSFFTLDDATKGVLDGVTYLLAGDILQDVTEYVRAVQISRGRSRELDRYSTGQATVILDNRDRRFDPTSVGSPYLGQIKPRKAVEVSTGGFRRLVGNVQDWQFMFDVSGDATASVVGVDGFGVLARQSLDDIAVGTATTSARVSAVLDAAGVSWPSALRDIESGGVSLIAGTATGNVLQYLQAVETAEAGDFYMSRDGLATWRNRSAAYTDTAYDAATGYDAAVPYSYPLPAVTTDLILTDEADDGSGTYCPYMTLALELGTDQLYNEVTVTRGTAAAITVTDNESQAAYGVAALSVDGGQLVDDAAGTALATYLLNRYREPVVRISEVSVELAGLPSAVIDRVLDLDLNDVLDVRFRPAYTGERVTRRSIVEGIAEEIRPDRHRITFRLSGAPGN
jgi:hypothetical protein